MVATVYVYRAKGFGHVLGHCCILLERYSYLKIQHPELVPSKPL